MTEDDWRQRKEITDFQVNEISALQFEVVATCGPKARVGNLTLPHHKADTPIFMPVGTQGTIKGLTSQQLEDIGCQIILGNTYHLAQRPGPDLLDHVGGLHKFMNWNRNILTDSGGFQMVSLLDLADINEEGVNFQSPHDGSQMLLTPEHSMKIQNSIGGDIMMALDDVVSSTCPDRNRVEEATWRTLRWMDRCIASHKKQSTQNLFGIVQGGLDPHLREICLEGLIKRNCPGYAIGGLSGGESKDQFWRTVSLCTDRLPYNKPRYCMGVGYPVDLIVCVALGVDMFDCVFPCRTARFGTALVGDGSLKLRSPQFATDFNPPDVNVGGLVNEQYTRAQLHTLACKEQTGAQLITYHNICYMMKLMSDMRTAIVGNYFDKHVKNFFEQQYPDHKYPSWAVDALASVEINL
ncbi:tRNA-guanine transglycosylase [Acrasis kona]|uniref:Queuine tRNA-ribosyltransferase catalytic subunit 1 n=1 Tax=Acrasis kona TaxID=1008807 RepID=A0AAW2YWG2_9EUKA